MNLSAIFIYRPVMTIMVMLAILTAGIFAYIQLPISSMPNVAFPTITVRVNFPGAIPETMANSVALPLEKQFMAIPGLRLVSSNNTLGNSVIVLQFEIDKDLDVAAQDVQAAITTALPYLPKTLPYGPTYRKVNPAELPFLYIGLTSRTMPRTDLYTYANTFIGQRISMIEGVSQVTTFGSALAVRVQVDPSKLAAYDVTLIELSEAIQLGNPYLATGQLDGNIEAPIISVDGQLKKPEDYNDLIVAYRNGTPLRISDLGETVNSFQNSKIYPQFGDGKEAQATIILAVQKEPDANIVAIADNINHLLSSLEKELPPAIDLHIVFDRSLPVRDAIEDATITLLIALAMVVLVIFLYLGKAADTIIPALVLPLSVIGTFAVMYLLGYTLDNLSVLALTLSIGFIIDDAIVVLENIVHHVEEGLQPLDAALEGSKQIGFTILSMTISLVAVFIPMLFMGGLIGKIFKEFSVTLTTVTILSGIISLSLTPMLCSKFIPARNKGEAKTTRISRFSDRMNGRMQNVYRRWLVAVLDHRKTALAIGLICLAATGWLIHSLPTDFIPDEDIGFFIAYTQGAEGGSSANMLDYENKLIEIIQSNPAVESFVAISSYSEYRKGLNLVHLKPIGERPPIQTVIQDIYQKAAQIPGFQVFIKNMPLIDLATGTESRGAYQYALQSIYPKKIYPSAQRLIDRMHKDPMFTGVNSDLEINTPQIDIAVLRDEAYRLGINAADIENTFALSYSGNLISRIQTPIDQYNVILELMPKYQHQASTFNNIWVRSRDTNTLTPLSNTISWEEGLGASSINHINQFPSVIVSFNLAAGVPLETALEKIDSYVKDVVDSGVTTRTIGAAQTFQESVNSAGILLLLSIFTIYIVLGILYESFIHPITILTTLPPATFGGLLTLYVLGLPLSMYSFLGIVLLIGIVKKNGIMMVDFALENIRNKGQSPREAIVEAALERFRPIMMTTVAAIFGTLPIALGIGANAAARRPLGLVIIGGLLLSQLITLFLTPILYLIMERYNETFTMRARNQP